MDSGKGSFGLFDHRGWTSTKEKAVSWIDARIRLCFQQKNRSRIFCRIARPASEAMESGQEFSRSLFVIDHLEMILRWN